MLKERRIELLWFSVGFSYSTVSDQFVDSMRSVQYGLAQDEGRSRNGGCGRSWKGCGGRHLRMAKTGEGLT